VVFLTEDFLGLLIGLSILHFFWSASLPLVEALTLGHLGGKPENYGRIRLWGSVGFILTVMGVGLLLDVAPIKSQLWVSWAIPGGTLISALTLTEVKGHGSHGGTAIGAVLRQRKVIYLMASAMLMTAAHGALYVFYSIHLVNQGYGKTLVGFPVDPGRGRRDLRLSLDAANLHCVSACAHSCSPVSRWPCCAFR
jgi:PPP family 3-phenylpropionic acid transporter